MSQHGWITLIHVCSSCCTYIYIYIWNWYKYYDREKLSVVEGYACGRVKHYLSQNSIKQAIQRLSPVGRTSRLESFHNVILRFAPKNLCFGFQAMNARYFSYFLKYWFDFFLMSAQFHVLNAYLRPESQLASC